MRGSKGDQPLPSQAAHWATPCARDHFPAHSLEYIAAKKAEGHGMRNLNDEAANWATPTARMHKGGGEAVTRADGKSRLDMPDWQAEDWSRRSPFPARPIAGGSMSSTDGPNSNQPSVKRGLNPIFVEALMRWPIGWTDFGCSETGLTQWRQRMRGYVWMLVTAHGASERQGQLL